MTRVADAMKRLGAASGSVREAPSSGVTRFFDPDQPAAVSPWNLGPRTAAPPHRRPVDTTPQEAVHVGPSASSEMLVISPVVSQVAREQYNRLAATLHQAQLERSFKVVMVTSAAPREGKTLTSANLALTLAGAYRRRVLLIDADLRHPTIHEVFGVPNGKGLGELLTASEPAHFVQVSAELSLLTAGTMEGHPMRALISERARALVDEVRSAFDWIIIDTPPIGLLPDAGLLLSITDGALLVALAGQTNYDDLQRAAETLGPDRIFGVVLNQVADAALPLPYGNYYLNDAAERAGVRARSTK